MSTKRSSCLIVNLLRLVLCALTVTLILRVGQYADSRAFQSSAPLLAEGKKYSSPNTDWLTLQDVLNSVERTYPLLLGAEQERAIAEADWMSAQGAFDLSFRPRADLELTGKYTHHYYDFMAEQPTTFWGTSFFGGYRVGGGNYATYDGKLETWDNGEWRTGLRVPFLRNGPIDRRRANLRLASLGKDLAGASVGLQRIAIFRAATRRYWEWVAAGRRLSITQSLLKIAETRNQNLSEMVNLGQIAPIEFTDNARTILERKAQLVAAERGLQAAAIELSMYYRGRSGDPMMPEATRLPLDFPDPKSLTEDQLQSDLELALKRCAGNKNLLATMVQCFLKEVRDLFPQMRGAFAKGDLAEVGRLGHRLRGTIVYLGAESAEKAAIVVEKCEIGGQQTEAEEAVRTLQRECEWLESAMARHEGLIPAAGAAPESP